MRSMTKNSKSDVVTLTIGRLTTACADRLDQATIHAAAASKLFSRGKTSAALKALMDAEPAAHEALDLFRAAMTLRSHLCSTTQMKSRR